VNIQQASTSRCGYTSRPYQHTLGHTINSAIDARPAPPHPLNFSYLPSGHLSCTSEAFDVRQDFFRPVLSENKRFVVEAACGPGESWGRSGDDERYFLLVGGDVSGRCRWRVTGLGKKAGARRKVFRLTGLLCMHSARTTRLKRLTYDFVLYMSQLFKRG